MASPVQLSRFPNDSRIPSEGDWAQLARKLQKLELPIIVQGISASGKSSLCNRLAIKLSCESIDPDDSDNDTDQISVIQCAIPTGFCLIQTNLADVNIDLKNTLRVFIHLRLSSLINRCVTRAYHAIQQDLSVSLLRNLAFILQTYRQLYHVAAEDEKVHDEIGLDTLSKVREIFAESNPDVLGYYFLEEQLREFSQHFILTEGDMKNVSLSTLASKVHVISNEGEIEESIDRFYQFLNTRF